MILLVLLSCRGGVENRDRIDHSHLVVVDDFAVKGLDGEHLGVSRMDTIRNFGGNINLDAAFPLLNAATADLGPGGIYYALPMPPRQQATGMKLDQILGPTLNYDIQPALVGLEIVADGIGTLKVRLDGVDAVTVWEDQQNVRQGKNELLFEIDLNPTEQISTLSIELAAGYAEIRGVNLLLDERRPFTSELEQAFVFSFGQLARCWDEDADLMHVRCTGFPEDIGVYGTDVTGLFALAAAVGADIGYVAEADARRIVEDVAAKLVTLPRGDTAGLLPDRSDGKKALAPDGTWSTLATVVGVEAAILAAHSFELDTSDLEGILEDVDWDTLTDTGSKPVLAGYDDGGAPLNRRYGVFGSTSIVVQIAHVAVDGVLAPMAQNKQTGLTWNGTGWENELAAVLFPMEGTDWNGNDWLAWRASQHWEHHTWSRESPAGDLGLFGLSTAEVPEPWALDAFVDPIGDWGLGGFGADETDGRYLVGYSFYEPYYPFMMAADYPDTVGPLITTLLERDLLTPLNAVESVGVADGGAVVRNHRLRAWTLALQTLGLARALAPEAYLPYRQLDTIPSLRDAHAVVMPEVDK